MANGPQEYRVGGRQTRDGHSSPEEMAVGPLPAGARVPLTDDRPRAGLATMIANIYARKRAEPAGVVSPPSGSWCSRSGRPRTGTA